MFTIVAWRVRGRGSGRRKEADVKAVRRRVAKGWRWVEAGEVGIGVAWKVEVWVGERRVERPVREIVKACGGGGASIAMDFGTAAVAGGAREPAMSALTASFTAADAAAALSIPCTSKFLRKSQAASTRSGVSKLMTPMVRWIAPTGRMAFAGSLAASFASLGGDDISAAKRWREDCSWGRDVGVTRGRRRKWVSWGFGLGGMVDGDGPWMWRGVVVEGEGRGEVRCCV